MSIQRLAPTSRLEAVILVLAIRCEDPVQLLHMLLAAARALANGASAARALSVANAVRTEVGHA